MKVLTVILTLAVFVALSAALSGNVSAQPLVKPVDRGCNASTQPFIFAQSDYGGQFDLNYCQYECRMRYGLEPSGTGGLLSETEGADSKNELHQSTTNYAQYAGCIADCNRTFWHQFESKKPGSGRTNSIQRPDVSAEDQRSFLFDGEIAAGDGALVKDGDRLVTSPEPIKLRFSVDREASDWNET